MVLLFIGRVKFLHLFALVGLCVVGMGFYLALDAVKTSIDNKHRLKEHEQALTIGAKQGEYKAKQNRIMTWSNRLKSMGEDKGEINRFDDKHLQRTYADIAVASGSVFGKGPGKSEQRNFLPHPYSDFIYAIIIEEYGLLGGIIVLMLYVILFTRVIRIVGKRPLTFGSLMAFGLGFLVLQGRNFFGDFLFLFAVFFKFCLFFLRLRFKFSQFLLAVGRFICPGRGSTHPNCY